MQHSLDYESRDEKHACPRCQSTHTITGDFASSDANGVKFIPDNLKVLAKIFSRGCLQLSDTPRVCTECGTIWAAVEPSELREVLVRWGNEGRKE